MQICICDDDLLHSSQIEGIILNYGKKFLNISLEVEVCHSAESLLKEIDTNQTSYQILFLDIEMGKMNGIEAAAAIRKKDSAMVIIFLTSYDRYTLKSFEVKPFRYVLKPVNAEDMTRILSHAIDEVMRNNQYLFYKHHNVQYQIRFDRITAIFSEKGRMIRVRTMNENESIVFYGKIKEVETMLNPTMFVKVNSGTVINLNHVNIISGNEIDLIDGQIVTMSRSQRKAVKEAYHHFVCRKVGMNI